MLHHTNFNSAHKKSVWRPRLVGLLFQQHQYLPGLSHGICATGHKLQQHALKKCASAAVGGFVVSTAPTTGVVTQNMCYRTQPSTARTKKCVSAAVGGFVVSTAPITGVVTQNMCYRTQPSTARTKKVCVCRGWWVCCFNLSLIHI